MKNTISAIALLLVCSFSAQAQFFSLGLKGGIHSQRNNFNDITVGQGENAFNLGVEDIKYGTQFGAYMRLGNKFFLQPEVLLNSNRTDFRINEPNAAVTVVREKYQNLDIPLLVGTTFGPFRLHGGPVAHYFLNSKSELTDINGFDEKWKELQWGWLAGLTIGKGRLSADLRYEGNFSKFGNHISFLDNQYNFSENPSRVVVALNFALVK